MRSPHSAVCTTKQATLNQGDLTTLDNLHATLSFEESAFHKPELKKEEEEIFQHYADWMLFNDTRFAIAPQEGTRFYDCPQVLYYDLMGLIPRERLSCQSDLGGKG